MTAEHVTPISAGGKHWFNNQVIACRTCNRWRSNTPLLLWLVALHRAQGNALIAARLVKRGLHA
jgi:5-methylcytosine-specific restriction endonuclease McrA